MNQGKQPELSDHWNLKKKHCFWKKTTGDDAKKTKRLTEVLTKKFAKRVFENTLRINTVI